MYGVRYATHRAGLRLVLRCRIEVIEMIRVRSESELSRCPWPAAYGLRLLCLSVAEGLNYKSVRSLWILPVSLVLVAFRSPSEELCQPTGCIPFRSF